MFFYTFLPKILNMSLTASVAILFVLLLRLLLRGAPKVISYALWGVVLFRLLCPVSVESGLSLFGLLDTPTVGTSGRTSTVEYIPADIVHTEFPEVVLPVPGMGEAVTEALPRGGEQLAADPLEAPMAIATCVWLGGVLVMAIYSIMAYVRLRRALVTASALRDNVYLADGIDSPFVMGLFRPKIYLPSELEEREQSYIILHEQHHIRRLDHLVKAAAFAALCVHWFNPLVWAAFILSGRDMEMSCDEAVVRRLGPEIRADYSASLLSLATGRRVIAGMPLAFGEGNTKSRIRNLANWKKPTFWVVLVAVVACAALAVCLLTNPKEDPKALLTLEQTYSELSSKGEDFDVGLIGIPRQRLIDAWGDPDGMLSGFYGDIWEVEGQGKIIVYYDVSSDSDATIQEIKLAPVEDDPVPVLEADGNAGGTVALSDGAAIVAFSDLDRDGETENIVVRTLDPGMLYELAVEKQDGTKLWTAEASPAHTGWNTILLYSEDGQDYLAQYRPAMFQGIGSYICTVFSLEGGRETVRQEWAVDFAVRPGDPVTVEETPEMARFAKEVGILLRNSTVLLSTEQGVLVDRPAAASALPQLYPVRFDPDEIQAAIDGREGDGTLTPNAARFPEAPVELLFASGAGAWGTFLTLNPDGSFTGSYSDAEMGDNAPEYPHGTYYVCDFEGRFTDIQQISDNAFSMRLESLTADRQEGETWIEDRIRYIASEAYGLTGGGDFLLFAPGTPADDLPADCRDWWPDAWRWRSGEVETLDGWALCNVDTGQGFF